MSSKPIERILSHRQEITDGGEPTLTRRRQVNEANGHGSLKHTIPSVAVEMLSLTANDEVRIEIYDDGYFVSPIREGDGDE